MSSDRELRDIAKAKQEAEDAGHSSEDRSGRFPEDAWLRNWGFRIRSRPGTEEPTWLSPTGVEMTHTEALRFVGRMPAGWKG